MGLASLITDAECSYYANFDLDSVAEHISYLR